MVANAYRCSQLMFIDECHFDARTGTRNRGWSLRGMLCVSKVLFVRGLRYSLVACVGFRGLVDARVVEGMFVVMYIDCIVLLCVVGNVWVLYIYVLYCCV